MEGHKWEDLETDCLVNVLGRVGMESLLLDGPFVCKSWYKASVNPSCWGLVFPNMEFDFPYNESFTSSITAFIKFIVNRSCKNATVLILPSSCTEEALTYVADWCPALRTLVLRAGLWYKQECIIIPRLVGKLKNLEHVTLGSSYNLNEILAQISLHCKNFKGLCVENAHIKKEEATAISSLLPNIKQLFLKGALIDWENLMVILQGCKELVHLDIRDCVDVEVNDKIFGLASHIHTFKFGIPLSYDYEYDSCDDDYYYRARLNYDDDNYYDGGFFDNDSIYLGCYST